jgi:hypothetical protein
VDNKSSEPPSSSENLQNAKQSLLEIYNEITSQKLPVRWPRAIATTKILSDQINDTIMMIENIEQQMRALNCYQKKRC